MVSTAKTAKKQIEIANLSKRETSPDTEGEFKEDAIAGLHANGDMHDQGVEL